MINDIGSNNIDRCLITGLNKQGHGLDPIDGSSGSEDDIDNGSYHNMSYGAMSNKKKGAARQGAGEADLNNVSRHSSQDVSMLSANKLYSGEKSRQNSRTKKRARDLDSKLISLNDVMMEASQNKNKIDAEQE